MTEIIPYLPKWQTIIDSLIKQTYKSDVFYKHSAAIIHKDKILSCGNNFRVKDASIHAEIDAFIKLHNKKHSCGLDIIVIRSGKDKLQYSRPCNHCIEFLKKKGFRKIYYSNEKGTIECEYITDMEQKHISSGKRFKLRNQNYM